MTTFFERLAERHPAFQGLLNQWNASRLPLVLQNQASECGVACIAMVLGYHGRISSLQEVRARLPVAPGSGSSVQHLITTAQSFGLRGRAVSVDLEDLYHLPIGTVLHWNMGHYVLLEHVDPSGVHLVDPALGRHTVDWNEASRAFTGVALILEPNDSFQKKGGEASALERLLRAILVDRAWQRVMLLAVIMQVLAFAMPALTGLVIERIVPQADDRMFSLSAVSAALVVAFFLLAWLVRSRLAALVMMRVSLQLRVDFIERLLLAPMRFVFDRSAGDIAFMNSGLDSVLHAITAGALTAAVDSIMALVFVTTLLVVSPTMGVVVLVIFLLHLALAAWSARRLTRLAASELYAMRKLATESTETVYGFETIKSLGLEGTRVSTSMNGLADMAQVQVQADVLRSWTEALQGAMRFGGPLTVLLLGTLLVRSGELRIGQMLALTSLAAAALAPLSTFSSVFSSMPRLHAYLERVQDVFTAEREQDVEKRRVTPPLSGALKLNDVTFRYSPVLPIVLRNITLEVRPGEFVAIVGQSGCGKSTLAGVILGLLEAESGAVEFDGETIDRLELVSLRKQLGYVPQRPQLFSQSVRDNLAVGDPAISFEQIIEAAKQAQIHEEIQQLPLGYETQISSFAVFSGGQRQRLALARALVRKPKILLLDEATSAVDTVTERRIDEVIRSLGCTRIVIAHRLTTIERADRIVVMKDGEIEAIGPLADVLKRSPTFQRLYQPGGQS